MSFDFVEPLLQRACLYTSVFKNIVMLFEYNTLKHIFCLSLCLLSYYYIIS